MSEWRYEAGLGIRPPRKGSVGGVRGQKVRAVVREYEPGGGMEVWHCTHDHAPGVKDCRQVTQEQAVSAMECAEGWLLEQIARGYLPEMPVTRDESYA